MAVTESERSVPNARHVHLFDVPAITTTNFDASVYGGTPTSIDADDAGAAGAATTISRSDHQHAFACAAAGTIAPDDTAAEGSAATMARSDHRHAITAGTPAALTKTATAAESAGTGFARDTHVHATSALPWGIVGRFSSTSSGSGITASATTDFSIASLVVDVARLYRVGFHSRWTIGTAAGAWDVNFHVGGTLTERIGNILTSGVSNGLMSHSFLWEPASATVTVDVRVNEVTDGSTLTFTGGAAIRRWFWVEDIGLR